MLLLQEEAELDEIVKMVGMDALSPADRMKLEAARSIREDYLHQNAFHETDTYTPPKKQYLMMKLILDYYDVCSAAIEQGADVEALSSLPAREDIGRFKYLPMDEIDTGYERINAELKRQTDEIIAGRDD